VTKQQAHELVEVLVASYPRDEITNETKLVYISDLMDLDYETAKAALDAVRRRYDRFPPLAGIWREVERKRMAHFPDVVVAWEQVQSYAFAIVTWRREQEHLENQLSTTHYEKWLGEGRPPLSVKPDSPLPEILEAMEYIGGVNAIRAADDENLSILRAQFRDAYKTILERRRDATVRELARASGTAQRLAQGRRELSAG
jgi:hypothetical protein